MNLNKNDAIKTNLLVKINNTSYFYHYYYTFEFKIYLKL